MATDSPVKGQAIGFSLLVPEAGFSGPASIIDRISVTRLGAASRGGQLTVQLISHLLQVREGVADFVDEQ